jgi:hypothetical protein
MEALATIIGMSAIGLISGVIRHNKKRSDKVCRAELEANCLMTKWPIVFVGGRKSLFYFQSYWNSIPQFLTDHGYEVYLMDLPWRAEAKRKKALNNFLRDYSNSSFQTQKFHLQVDSSSLSDILELVAEHDISAIASISLYHAPNDEEALRNIISKRCGLRSLKTPIEFISLEAPKDESRINNLIWKMHKIWTSNISDNRQILGFCPPDAQQSVHKIYLNRMQFLAERDYSSSDTGSSGPEWYPQIS